MHLIPLKTPRLEKGDDLVSALVKAIEGTCSGRSRSSAADGDILVISSKAVATSEGNIIDLSKLSPTDEAKSYAKQCGRSAQFCQAVLEETEKRNGRVVGICSGAMLTELAPWRTSSFDSELRVLDRRLLGACAEPRRSAQDHKNMHDNMGAILTANAGLDESNTEKNTAVGWPEDPVASVRRLQCAFQKNTEAESGELGAISQLKAQSSKLTAVIISDSCCRPRRLGVTAFALTCAGIDPFFDQAGRKDLFGRPLHITKEAIADQLATAANMLMGNADQSIPAVIIRDHGFELSDFIGWVPGIDPKEDLFREVYEGW